MARMYVRSITRSTMYQKAPGVWKISSVACGFSSIEIDYSDYPKSLISRINEVYVCSIKYRNIKMSRVYQQGSGPSPLKIFVYTCTS